MRHQQQNPNDTQKAGTGFMLAPCEALENFERRGYDKNIVPRFDHFEVDSGRIQLFPEDFTVDEFVRFENTSDPDDQSILYAITSRRGLRGTFVESYGLYHENLSEEMLRRLTRRRP